MYLPGKLTATPSPDSALVELTDDMNKPRTGFERRRLRRVPKEGGAATIAHAAAAAGATSLVRGLVARGVDVATTVDPESFDGALHLATRFGRAETARLLLEEGGGCWRRQPNKLQQYPEFMAPACAVVAARPALSRVFYPPACDLELAQQRRCVG